MISDRVVANGFALVSRCQLIGKMSYIIDECHYAGR